MTHGHELLGGEFRREGVGRMEWSEGGEWDNCNNIINKYIFKKSKRLQKILLETHQSDKQCTQTKP